MFETGGQGPWFEVAKLERDNPPTEQGFGRSVAISGETVLVGAHLALVTTGAVYQAAEEPWTEQGASIRGRSWRSRIRLRTEASRRT